MMIFLILAPYGAFAGLMLLTSPAVSLFAAAAFCPVSYTHLTLPTIYSV